MLRVCYCFPPWQRDVCKRQLATLFAFKQTASHPKWQKTKAKPAAKSQVLTDDG